MTYYKIIKDKQVVDVGFSFLKWNQKYRQVYDTDTEKAQFVKGEITQMIYRDSWLKPVAEEALVRYPEEAKVVTVNETEYSDLYAQLTEGEQVKIDTDSPEVKVPHEYVEEPEEDKPLTVSEMRAVIKQQSAEIDRLMNCIVEMSEVVYHA